VPKKLLVFGSHFAEEFADSRGFGWAPPDAPPSHDWAALIASKNKEVQRLSGVYGRILANAGVTYIEGRGKLLDAHTVEVDGVRYTAANILVATGGRASLPGIPGEELGLTSDDALELPACPRRVAVMGAGYIGLEFAGIFSAFGAEAHVFFRGELPLRGFDEEVRTIVAEQLTEKGVALHPGVTPVSVAAVAGGAKLLTLSDGSTLEVDEILFATGRSPNVRGLGLEALGVAMGRNGAIAVDAYSRSSVASVYAVGDVTDRINLTPVALAEGMALSRTLFKGEPTAMDHSGVPCAVFSQPPVATVGLTEAQAVAAVGDVDVFTTAFKPLKNTVSGRTEKMFMKLVVDAKTDVVLGVHLVGPDVPEMLQGFAVALKCGATKAQFDATVGLHPTAAEELVTMRSVTRQVRAAAKL
jgi:glutathione reductase (NADPH)